MNKAQYLRVLKRNEIKSRKYRNKVDSSDYKKSVYKKIKKTIKEGIFKHYSSREHMRKEDLEVILFKLQKKFKFLNIELNIKNDDQYAGEPYSDYEYEFRWKVKD